MFEHRTKPLLSRVAFIIRMTRAFLFTILIVTISVAGGAVSYRLIEGLSWVDAFHESALVLGEKDLTHFPTTIAGKAFVGIFVMYARLMFFTVVAILILPMAHRVLHKLHLDCSLSDDEEDWVHAVAKQISADSRRGPMGTDELNIKTLREVDINARKKAKVRFKFERLRSERQAKSLRDSLATQGFRCRIHKMPEAKPPAQGKSRAKRQWALDAIIEMSPTPEALREKKTSFIEYMGNGKYSGWELVEGDIEDDRYAERHVKS